MSDFDEEAERERLREKYERDQRKREATEKMSDLLLKGATMTNAHCETCGDPIFRYDGQEFCPTCEEVVAEDVDGEAGAERAAEGGAGDSEDASTAADATVEGDATVGEDEPDDAPAGATNGDAASPTDPAAAPGNASDDGSETPSHIEIKRPAGSSAGANAATGADESGSPGNSPSATGDSPPSSGGLRAARESLVRTLVRQAREAEDCDDPRRARDHLAAAREAAEALSALSY